jgi:hypothetical protein
MVRHPVAGNILAFLHYVVGLSRLGHEVVYVEESGWPWSAYDPERGTMEDYPHGGLRTVRKLMEVVGVPAPVWYVHREAGTVDGTDWDQLKRTLRTADLLLNIGGVCWLSEFELCPRRVLIDMDPFFTQVERFAAKVLDDYQVHFTYGTNIGRPGCIIPTTSVNWISTFPPVVLDMWPFVSNTDETRPFTTVANWTSYGDLLYEGESYGQKDREFMRLIDLPAKTSQKFELVLSNVPPEVTERLCAAGWSVKFGAEVSSQLETYQQYIASSRGEFSAAKHAYVKSRSGWFSDRSVCYLAAGRPVVLQDTGFSDWLPTGCGLMAFSSVAEAANCIERVNADYLAHRKAAREIADRAFDYRVVLPRLLKRALG